ncbi:hypothetical protein A2U01_0110475, partial [Trifolium medium]|nr:hypothetical protein [Trifolium medium]
SPGTETPLAVHPLASHILNLLALLNQYLKLSNP